MPFYLWIFVGIAIFLTLWLILIFNGLIRSKNRVKEAWTDIDVQLRRRYDLIPNLVETVKGYAAHEKEVFEKVTEARTKAMAVTTPEEHSKAENMLTGTLKSLFAVAEAYPTLRASENFMKLQEELSDTENKIQAARRFYNSNVRDYNIKIGKFPNNIIAGLFNFKEEEFFELEARAIERERVEVKF